MTRREMGKMLIASGFMPGTDDTEKTVAVEDHVKAFIFTLKGDWDSPKELEEVKDGLRRMIDELGFEGVPISFVAGIEVTPVY